MAALLFILLIAFLFGRPYLFPSKKTTHAGGIVYKAEAGVTKYLLVTGKNNKLKWVLPKGHIEANEREEDAAVREVLEEAGIEATIVKKIGNVQQVKDFFTPINTSFYLMRYVSVAGKGEDREQLWLPLNEAIAKVTVTAQKEILKKVQVTTSSAR